MCNVSYGQSKKNPNWIYFNDLTVKEFIDTLTVKEFKTNVTYILVTGNRAKVGWIKSGDIKFLMELIGSLKSAFCVMQSISSNMPFVEKSTVGGQIMNLIDAYRVSIRA